jgi:hypothetical protein
MPPQLDDLDHEGGFKVEIRLRLNFMVIITPDDAYDEVHNSIRKE